MSLHGAYQVDRCTRRNGQEAREAIQSHGMDITSKAQKYSR